LALRTLAADPPSAQIGPMNRTATGALAALKVYLQIGLEPAKRQ
jgi:hypothetical protein